MTAGQETAPEERVWLLKIPEVRMRGTATTAKSQFSVTAASLLRCCNCIAIYLDPEALTDVISFSYRITRVTSMLFCVDICAR